MSIGRSPDRVPEWELLQPPELAVRGGAGVPYFGRVRDAAWTRDGKLVVLDAGRHSVDVFDSAGVHRRSVGAEGSGPGEFDFPVTLSTVGPDSIFVYDRAQDRLSVFHVRTGFIRTVPFREGDADWPPLQVWASGPDRLVAYRLRPVAKPPDGPYPRRRSTEASLTLHDGEGRVLAGPVTFAGTYSAQVRTGDVALPFAHEPVLAVGGGRVLFGSGKRYRLIVLDGRFRVRRVIRWPGWDVPVSSEEIEAVRREIRRSFRRLPPREAKMLEEAMLSPDLLPEIRPALDDVLLDPEGRIWVARFRPNLLGPPDRWQVLGRDGRPLAQVRLPAGARLVAVREERAMLVHTDTLDVPHVAVYRLEGR